MSSAPGPALAALVALAALAAPLRAQVPFEALKPEYRGLAQSIVQKANFTFNTRTQPKRVRLATMEQLFDHPRLGAAMWRCCQFVPSFHAFTRLDGSWTIDDGRGLRGTMTLLYHHPGLRVYLVEGRAEAGRLKPLSPAVGARMITVYRYWETPQGFESLLQSWTQLDSALLGFLARPFQSYIKHRQDEFIAYINNNIALFGEFAHQNPREFQLPLKRDGDPAALQEFEAIFMRK